MDPEAGTVTSERHREGEFFNLPRSFSDDDIEKTLEGYMETKCARTDPEQARTEGISSDELLEKFLADTSKKVLLLQGRAGAGKSTLGKKWAVELWKKWTEGDRIPLFLHLPRHTSVKEHLKEQGVDLEGQWGRFIKDRSLLVILDSFDEMGKKENVVKKVCGECSGCTDLNIVIACRSDYLQRGEGSEALFLPKPRDGPSTLLETVWVCPLEMSNKALVDRYIDHYVSACEHGWGKQDYERALTSFPELGEIIKTPFVLKVTLSSLTDEKGLGLEDHQAQPLQGVCEAVV
eukprot:766369-Hanusia_phi.AAC.1